jgi:hypothetical protein
LSEFFLLDHPGSIFWSQALDLPRRIEMAEKYSQEELKEARFTQLIFSFQATAMQQMGKLMNPLTGKVERNMEQAKHFIDIVAMLEEKTRGNLNEREKNLIERVLFELRMNYLDELKVGEEQKQQETEKVAEGVEQRTQKEEMKAKKKKAGKKTKKSTKGKPRKKKTS